MRVTMLPFYNNDMASDNYLVCHCSIKKKNEVWKLDIHKLDQIDARYGHLCTNV